MVRGLGPQRAAAEEGNTKSRKTFAAVLIIGHPIARRFDVTTGRLLVINPAIGHRSDP
jgi:hypothetical protein